MSFFGFDTTLPRDRGHSANAPGFGQTPDAFAGLGGGAAADDDDAIDFEDTYDGLGDRLDETDDAFNDDTFGGGPASQQNIGKDFDFAGQTSKISNTLQEEQMLYQARQAPSQQRAQPQHQPQPPKPPKPSRTGYESYHDPNYIPQLEARADIWGLKPKQPTAPTREPENQAPPPEHQPAKKIVSLEEVEAMIRAQTLQHERAVMQQQQQQQQQAQQSQQTHTPAYPQQQVPHSQPHFPGISGQGQFVPHILQRPQQVQQQAQQQAQQQPPPQHRAGSRPQQVHAELPAHSVQAPPTQHPTILQRQRPPPNDPAIQQQRNAQPQSAPQRPPSQPRQILQNPSRLSGQGQPMVQPGMPAPQGPRGSGHNRGPSYPGMVVTNPEQLLHLSKEDREAFLAEDAKRAKRNHKIAQLSKDNGLMTPQDKNFITRIQLQQLMTATGNLDEQSPETVLAEDFYYQVFSQIRGAPRQAPHQPASQFAQTYLFQTNRYGAGRRQGRGADNHMQRMEQQVQRAVEAAKAKPKAKQLTIEGSLGKISFSNSKTPRPLLSMKRPVSHEQHPHKPKVSVADRKETLRNIENVYMTLMRMEDHERTMPGQLNQDSSPEVIQKHMEWRTKIEALHKQLWEDIKIMEPINPASLTPHPFIAILSHAKGKKAIPRIFRHIDEQERITILTMVVVHLDKLNVVSHGVATPEHPLSPAMRDEIELFLHSVVPPLYAHIFESPLNIIIGLLGLILERTNVHVVARTKVGMSLLIMLISRAELLKEPPEINVVDWENWTTLYNRLFDSVEPVLPAIFPGSINDTDDMYVWQFLAAMGVGASPEQQQRLVLGVKDRVMETVGVSKALPPEMASARLANVNLFMRAIGLDVELLG